MRNQLRGALGLLGRTRFAGVEVFFAGLAYSLLLHFTDNTVNPAVPINERIAILLVVHQTTYSLIKYIRKHVFIVGRGGLQPLKAMFALFVGGLVRGLLLYSLTNTFKLYVIDDFWFRVVNSVLNVMAAFALMGIADQAYREWQVRKTELLQTNARLRALLKRETEKSDADHQRLVDTVSGQLVRFIREIDNALPKDAADSLRRGITEIVRPLSRQMDAVNYQEAPPEGEDGKVSWRQVFTNVRTARPLEPVLVPVAMVLVAIPFVALNYGFDNIFRVLSLVLISGILTYWAFEQVFGRIPLPWWLSWTLLVVSGLTTATFQALVVLTLLPTFENTARLMAVLCTFNATLVSMIAVTKSLFAQIEQVEQELKDRQHALTWALARETEVHRQRSRALAIALHGPVQTAVGAGIIRLENAAKRGPVSQELVTEVTDLIYESLDQLQAGNKVPDLTQVLEELGQTWQGICQIEVKARKANLKHLARDAVSVSLLAEFIPELCFNAIKHGGAKNISIQLNAPAANLITVLITDDGVRYEPGPNQGIGLKHLLESAIEITREYRNASNEVSLTLPYQTPPKERGGGSKWRNRRPR